MFLVSEVPLYPLALGGGGVSCERGILVPPDAPVIISHVFTQLTNPPYAALATPTPSAAGGEYSLTLPSVPPETMRPPRAQWTQSALPSCAASVWRGTAERMSHTLTVLSCDADTRWCAFSWLQATVATKGSSSATCRKGIQPRVG